MSAAVPAGRHGGRQGEPCVQGETARETGCVPKDSKGGTSDDIASISNLRGVMEDPYDYKHAAAVADNLIDSPIFVVSSTCSVRYDASISFSQQED
ncbi:MAG: hypothetical protein Q9M27_06635 [Mariprofundaceae bacterium]|nr:hypothetical protein [Mariprofundaceae bacterium]